MYKPGCIFNKNHFEVNVTYASKNEDTGASTNELLRYKIDMNINSGSERKFNGRLVETNSAANGKPLFFKAVSGSDTKVVASLPFYKGCS